MREVGHRLTDSVQECLEQAAILSGADRLQRRPQHAQAVPLDDARVGKLDRQVEGGLPTERGQQSIRTLRGDDPLQHTDGQGLDVHGVGDIVVGHDGGGVAVDQHHADPLLTQCPAGLRPGVVELSGLPDDNRPTADDQDATRCRGAARSDCDGRLVGGEFCRRRRGRWRLRSPRHWRRRLFEQAESAPVALACPVGNPGPAHAQELVEHLGSVLGARRPLGVVLHAERGQLAVPQALHAVVVEVALTDVPAAVRRDAVRIHLELVVVRRDPHGAALLVTDRVVAAVVAERQSRGGGADGTAQHLVAEADSQQGDAPLEQGTGQGHRAVEPHRVTGAVGKEHAVRTQRQDLVDGRVVADNDNGGAAAAQSAQLVVLHPHVDHHHAHAGEGVAGAGEVDDALQRGVEPFIPLDDRLAVRDVGDEVLVGDGGRLARRLDLLLRAHRLRGCNDPAQRAVVAQMTCQRARVDPAQAGNAPAAELLIEGALGARVTGIGRQLAHHQSAAVHAV